MTMLGPGTAAFVTTGSSQLNLEAGRNREQKHICLALQDMHKLMNKDKIILRFTARMTPGQSAVSHADAGELQTRAWQHLLLLASLPATRLDYKIAMPLSKIRVTIIEL
jgi:hypothetical protein